MSKCGLRTGLALAVVALSTYGPFVSNSGALHAAQSQGIQKVRRAPPPVVSTVGPVPLIPRQIAQNSFPSVVLLLTQDAEGQPLAFGSAFFVQPGIIATNVHVIEAGARGSAKIVGQTTKYE